MNERQQLELGRVVAEAANVEVAAASVLTALGGETGEIALSAVCAGLSLEQICEAVRRVLKRQGPVDAEISTWLSGVRAFAVQRNQVVHSVWFDAQFVTEAGGLDGDAWHPRSFDAISVSADDLAALADKGRSVAIEGARLGFRLAPWRIVTKPAPE